jgi:hypothetical protein
VSATPAGNGSAHDAVATFGTPEAAAEIEPVVAAAAGEGNDSDGAESRSV